MAFEESEELREEMELFAIMPFLCNEKSLLQGWKLENRRSSSSIKIINDAEVASPVVSLESNEFDKTWISFPDNKNKFIGTPYSFIIMQVKTDKYMGFEINISDENDKQKIFQCTNKQSLARLIENKCSLPLKLDNGEWNIIIIDLQSLTKKVFNTKYKHCNRIKIFANTRVRRIYFAKDLYQEHQLPEQYKIYGMRNPLLINQKGIIQTHI